MAAALKRFASSIADLAIKIRLLETSVTQTAAQIGGAEKEFADAHGKLAEWLLWGDDVGQNDENLQ